MVTNPQQLYLKNQIETSSPERLIIILYDSAVRFLKTAVSALDNYDLEKCNDYSVRAQNIISELMFSLDLSRGEVAANLYNLYDYMLNRLIQANIAKDRQAFEEIAEMLVDLKKTWGQAILNINKASTASL